MKNICTAFKFFIFSLVLIVHGFSQTAEAIGVAGGNDEFPGAGARAVQPAPAPAAEPSPELKAAVDERLCHTRIAPILREYFRISETWLSNNESRFNLERNFADFQASSQKKFDAIRDFQNSGNGLPASTEDLQKRMLDNRHSLDALLATLVNLSEADTLFLSSLNTLQSGLVTLGNSFSVDTGGCRPSTVKAVSDAKEALNAYVLRVEAIKTFVSSTLGKRASAATLVYLTKNNALKTQYAQHQVASLDELIRTIEQSFKAAALLDEVDNWVTDILIARTPDHRAVSDYLTFEKALAVLKSEYLQGDAIRKRIVASQLTADQRAIVQGNVNVQLKGIRDMITKTEAGGWEAKLGRQKLLTEKVISMGSRFTAACQAVAQVTSVRQSKATDLQTYRFAEAGYHDFYDACMDPQSQKGARQ